MGEADDVITFDMPQRHDPRLDIEIGYLVSERNVPGDVPTLALDPNGDYEVLKREQHPDKPDWWRFTLQKVR